MPDPQNSPQASPQIPPVDLSGGFVPKDTAQAPPVDLSGGLVPKDSGQPAQSEQPGWLDRSIEGVKQSLKGTFAPLVGAVSEPQDAQEHAVSAVGSTSPLGSQGTLAAYRAAKTLVDSSEHMLKAPQEHFQQAKQDFIRAAKDLHDKNYLGMVRDLASASESTQGMDAGCGIGDRRPQA